MSMRIAYETMSDLVTQKGRLSPKKYGILGSRTVNHFLRGAVKCGNSCEAYHSYQWLIKYQKESVDWTSVSLLVELLCSSGQSQLAHSLYVEALESNLSVDVSVCED